MRKLILIKHSRPQVVERVPSDQWTLSDEGQAACGPLAEAVRALDPAVIVTSDEAKAIETGKLVAGILNKPLETAPDLHEHDRSNVPMMRSGEFLSALAMFFKDRSRLVLGKETADGALARFERAVESVLREYDRGNVAVVTHGTVLALFAEKNGAGDGFGLYRRLGLPSIVTFEVPGYRLLETIERIH
ncbi:MAG TPA: histidine phosphatase family protein [Tepidisphaeraceae bacterium]|nr:histidine phosphatase family protein [Tepidisphaeraceae bacterium]